MRELFEITTDADKVCDTYKLKEYLDVCIDFTTNEILTLREHATQDVLDILINHRNMLLAIKEICKNRNKF